MKLKNVILLLDVDCTLATDHIRFHLSIYKRRHGLNLTKKQIYSYNKIYKSTLEVPEIKALQQSDYHNFLKTRQYIHKSAHLANKLSVQKHSLRGVHELFKFCRFGGYYTCRDKSLKRTTAEWLENHNFPYPEKLSVVSTHKSKIQSIINDWKNIIENNRTIFLVLIDDCSEQLLQIVSHYRGSKEENFTLRHLILVKFEDKATTDKINDDHLLHLQSWKSQDVTKLIQSINEYEFS